VPFPISRVCLFVPILKVCSLSLSLSLSLTHTHTHTHTHTKTADDTEWQDSRRRQRAE
jgi:hypothetical protein